MVLTVTSSPIAFPLLVILDAGNSPRRRPQQTAHPRSNWSLWVESKMYAEARQTPRRAIRVQTASSS